MTVVSYPLGTPRPAANRGGDCRARDLSQGRNVHGGHRFAATADCRISNGLLRLTVGAVGMVPALTLEGRRGRVTVGDVYGDTYRDTYGGEIGPPEWLAMGTLTIDSPSVSAILTRVRLVRVNLEAVTIRLVTPLLADIFVTLRRGERMVHIQHGSTRGPQLDIDRRTRLTDSPSPVGTAALGRVEEVSPVIDGFPRWIGSIDPVTVTAGTFSVVASSSVTARFGAGVATYAAKDQPLNQHQQTGNASRPRIVVA